MTHGLITNTVRRIHNERTRCERSISILARLSSRYHLRFKTNMTRLIHHCMQSVSCTPRQTNDDKYGWTTDSCHDGNSRHMYAELSNIPPLATLTYSTGRTSTSVSNVTTTTVFACQHTYHKRHIHYDDTYLTMCHADHKSCRIYHVSLSICMLHVTEHQREWCHDESSIRLPAYIIQTSYS